MSGILFVVLAVAVLSPQVEAELVVLQWLPSLQTPFGSPFSYQIPDGTFSLASVNLSWALQDGCHNFELNDTTYTVTGNPTSEQLGYCVLTLTVTNLENGDTVSTILSIYIYDPLDPPPVLLRELPVQKAYTGLPFLYTIPYDTFADPYGQPLTYTLSTPSNTFTFQPEDNSIRGRPFYGSTICTACGTFNLTITATDSSGQSCHTNLTIEVFQRELYINVTAYPSDILVRTTTNLVCYTMGTNKSFVLNGAPGADKERLKYFVDINPAGWLVYVSATDGGPGGVCAVNGIPATARDQPTQVELLVFHIGSGAAQSVSFSVTVENTPPVVHTSMDQPAPVFVGRPFFLPLNISDVDGDKLSIDILKLPDWLGWSPLTFSFNGTAMSKGVGGVNIDFQLSDGYMATPASYRLFLRVYQPEIIIKKGLPDIVAYSGQNITINVNKSKIFELVGMPSSYTEKYGALLELHSDDRGLGWLQWNRSNESWTGRTSGAGNLVVPLDVSYSPLNLSISTSFNVQVINRPPERNNSYPWPSSFVTHVGVPFKFVIAEDAFRDPDGNEVTLVAFGLFPSWLTFTYNVTSKNYTLSGTPGPGSQKFHFPLYILARDNFGSQASATSTWLFSLTVANRPVAAVSGLFTNRDAVLRIPFLYQLSKAMFRDPDGDNFTAQVFSVQPGPGSTPWLSVLSPLTVGGTPSEADLNTTTRVTVRLVDTWGDFSTASFDVTVRQGRLLVASAIPDQQALVFQQFLLEIPPNAFALEGFPNSNSGDLVYSARGLPAWLTVVSPRTLTGMPRTGHQGASTITISVYFPLANLTTHLQFNLVVLNRPPEVSNGGDGAAAQYPQLLIAHVGETVAFHVPNVTVVDPDGDNVTYTMAGRPGWASFDAQTRMLTGTPRSGDQGDSHLIVIAMDALNASSFFHLTLRVPNRAPTFTANNWGENHYAYVGSSFLLPLAGSFIDPDQDPLVFSSPTLPPNHWLRLNNLTQALVGTPPPGAQGEKLAVRIVATDPKGLIAQSTLLLEVKMGTLTQLKPMPDINGVLINKFTSFPVPSATFDLSGFPGVNESQLTYSAHGLPAWLSVDPVTGIFSGTPRSGHQGKVTVTVTATYGPAGLSANATFTVSVSNRFPYLDPLLPQPIHVVYGRPFRFELAEYVQDDDADPLSVLLGFGSPNWLAVESGTALTLKREPTEGPYEVTAMAKDGFGGELLLSFSLLVSIQGIFPVSPIPNVEVYIGDMVNFTLNASGRFVLRGVAGHDANAILFRVKNSLIWLTYSEPQATFTGVASSGDQGTTSVQVQAWYRDLSRDIFLEANTTFNITVLNRAPIFTPPNGTNGGGGGGDGGNNSGGGGGGGGGGGAGGNHSHLLPELLQVYVNRMAQFQFAVTDLDGDRVELNMSWEATGGKGMGWVSLQQTGPGQYALQILAPLSSQGVYPFYLLYDDFVSTGLLRRSAVSVLNRLPQDLGSGPLPDLAYTLSVKNNMETDQDKNPAAGGDGPDMSHVVDLTGRFFDEDLDELSVQWEGLPPFLQLSELTPHQAKSSSVTTLGQGAAMSIASGVEKQFSLQPTKPLTESELGTYPVGVIVSDMFNGSVTSRFNIRVDYWQATEGIMFSGPGIDYGQQYYERSDMTLPVIATVVSAIVICWCCLFLCPLVREKEEKVEEKPEPDNEQPVPQPVEVVVPHEASVRAIFKVHDIYIHKPEQQETNTAAAETVETENLLEDTDDDDDITRSRASTLQSVSMSGPPSNPGRDAAVEVLEGVAFQHITLENGQLRRQPVYVFFDPTSQALCWVTPRERYYLPERSIRVDSIVDMRSGRHSDALSALPPDVLDKEVLMIVAHDGRTLDLQATSTSAAENDAIVERFLGGLWYIRSQIVTQGEWMLPANAGEQNVRFVLEQQDKDKDSKHVSPVAANTGAGRIRQHSPSANNSNHNNSYISATSPAAPPLAEQLPGRLVELGKQRAVHFPDEQHTQHTQQAHRVAASHAGFVPASSMSHGGHTPSHAGHPRGHFSASPPPPGNPAHLSPHPAATPHQSSSPSSHAHSPGRLLAPLPLGMVTHTQQAHTQQTQTQYNHNHGPTQLQLPLPGPAVSVRGLQSPLSYSPLRQDEVEDGVEDESSPSQRSGVNVFFEDEHDHDEPDTDDTDSELAGESGRPVIALEGGGADAASNSSERWDAETDTSMQMVAFEPEQPPPPATLPQQQMQQQHSSHSHSHSHSRANSPYNDSPMRAEMFGVSALAPSPVLAQSPQATSAAVSYTPTQAPVLHHAARPNHPASFPGRNGISSSPAHPANFPGGQNGISSSPALPDASPLHAALFKFPTNDRERSGSGSSADSPSTAPIMQTEMTNMPPPVALQESLYSTPYRSPAILQKGPTFRQVSVSAAESPYEAVRFQRRHRRPAQAGTPAQGN
eukprot:g79531.t1